MGVNAKWSLNKWKESIKVNKRETNKKANETAPIVFDDERNMTDLHIDKNIIYQYGLNVQIIIISKDGENILLQQNGESEQWPNFYDVIGEHILTGNHTPTEVAKQVMKRKLGKNWHTPSYEFDIVDTMHYKSKGENPDTKHNPERKHVYVIEIDNKDDYNLDTLNAELAKIRKDKQKTVKYRWFSKEELDESFSTLSKTKIVPHIYFLNYNWYSDFISLFRGVSEKINSERDLEI